MYIQWITVKFITENLYYAICVYIVYKLGIGHEGIKEVYKNYIINVKSFRNHTESMSKL